MEQYVEQLNRRKQHKEDAKKYREILDILLKDRYSYSVNELLLAMHISTEAYRVKILLNKVRQVAFGKWQQLMIDNNIAYEVYKDIDPFGTWDSIHDQMDKLREQCHEQGIKYINTDVDVANAYHSYDRHTNAVQALKYQMNTVSGKTIPNGTVTFSNSTHGKLGINK